MADAGDGFHVVDHGGGGVEAGNRGEWRSQARLAPAALQRVEQRGFLAADIGTRARVHDQFEVEARTLDVGAEVTGLVRLRNSGLQSAQHGDHFAAHVDEGVVRADCVRRDDHPLHQEVRRCQHQRNVFARTGFRLVGVDHQVVRFGSRASVVLRDERPLRTRREACAAAAAQTRILHGGDDVVGGHAKRSFERLVAVVATVGVKRPRFGFVPEPAQNGSQLCHGFDSVASGSVSGFFGFGGTVADGPGAG